MFEETEHSCLPGQTRSLKEQHTKYVQGQLPRPSQTKALKYKILTMTSIETSQLFPSKIRILIRLAVFVGNVHDHPMTTIPK